MQSIDGRAYRKYFSMRRQQSKRPEKTKLWQKAWISRELIMDFCREKIAEAQKNGQLDAPKPWLLRAACLHFGAFGRAWDRPREFCRPPSALIRAENLHPGILGCQNAGRKAHGLDGRSIESELAADVAAVTEDREEL